MKQRGFKTIQRVQITKATPVEETYTGCILTMTQGIN